MRFPIFFVGGLSVNFLKWRINWRINMGGDRRIYSDLWVNAVQMFPQVDTLVILNLRRLPGERACTEIDAAPLPRLRKLILFYDQRCGTITSWFMCLVNGRMQRYCWLIFWDMMGGHWVCWQNLWNNAICGIFVLLVRSADDNALQKTLPSYRWMTVSNNLLRHGEAATGRP